MVTLLLRVNIMQMKKSLLISILALLTYNVNAQSENYTWRAIGNPIITHKHSADPAPFVKNDTLWLYTGCDYQGNQNNYQMYEWNLYSTTDMINWTEHPTPLKVSEFKWQN